MNAYLDFYMTKLMMLVSAEFTPFTSKKTHEKVEGWKYIFLTPQNEYVVFWGKTGVYKDDATGLSEFDKTKAKEYPIKLKEFDGKVSQQLFEQDLPKV
jgi:hypothetical protein